MPSVGTKLGLPLLRDSRALAILLGSAGLQLALSDVSLFSLDGLLSCCRLLPLIRVLSRLGFLPGLGFAGTLAALRRLLCAAALSQLLRPLTLSLLFGGRASSLVELLCLEGAITLRLLFCLLRVGTTPFGQLSCLAIAYAIRLLTLRPLALLRLLTLRLLTHHALLALLRGTLLTFALLSHRALPGFDSMRVGLLLRGCDTRIRLPRCLRA